MYFSNFPILQYPLIGTDDKGFDFLTSIFVTNVIRRVSLSQEMKSDDSIFIEMYIDDGDRPEHIAEKIYGDPTYNWLVMLANTIIDPYHGWCKSSVILEEYIEKKYHGYSLFISKDNKEFFYNDGISGGSVISQGGKTASVFGYVPNLCKILINDSFFTIGSAVIGNEGRTTYDIRVNRIDPSWLAVHHFEINKKESDLEDFDVLVLDPLSKQTNQYYSSFINGVSQGYADLGGTIGSANLPFDETNIGKYMGVSGNHNNLNVVTNYDFEQAKNEEKRKIKLIHPRYKEQALIELKALLAV